MRQNRVSHLELSEDGSEVRARTRGSRPQPYRQHIRLRRNKAGEVLIEGSCSCPMEYNCKHVAAVLVAARARWSEAGPSPEELVPESESRAELPPELLDWLTDLQRSEQEDCNDYPPEVRQRLFYVFKAERRPGRTALLRIELVTAQELKKGGLGRPTSFPLHAWPAQEPRHVRPVDRPLIERLSRQVWDAHLIESILGTGRARWADVDGSALRQGPPRAGRLAWVLNEADGSQTPAIEINGAGKTLLMPTSRSLPPSVWYVDQEAGLVGPVSLDLPAGMAGRLLSAPPIPAALLPVVREELSRLAEPGVPLPRDLDPPEQVKGPPVPVLRLTTATTFAFQRFQYGEITAPVGRLAFRYGPILVYGRSESPVLAHEGRLYSIRRNRRAEARARNTLLELGFEPFFDYGPIRPDRDERPGFSLDSPEEWMMFLLRVAPALRGQGWDIEAEPDFPIRLVEPDRGEVTAELTEGSGIDWLDLHLGVTIGGESLDLVPVLAPLIASMSADMIRSLAEETSDDETPFIAPLPDGRVLTLRLSSIRPILLALFELFSRGTLDPGNPKIAVSRHDAAEITALEEASSGLVWKGGEALRALGRELRAAGDKIPHIALPSGFNATLRPYQASGVDWLQMLCGAGLGAVLADDMGLGKTVQTLAHLAIEKEQERLDHPALIVCPTSLVPNWCSEAARFAPGLRVLALHGLGRKEHFAEIRNHDIVVTTYKLLPRDVEVLRAQQWHVLVLDEAQAVKNPLADTTRHVKQLKARQCVCLSGTPLENHLGELWSLFDIVAPGFLGTREQFRKAWRTPIEKKGDELRRQALARRVRLFLLRRTKEQVATDLPPKTEIVERIDLDAGQRAIYDSVRLAMHKRVRDAIAAQGLARSGIVILDALLKMRQACCDPRLLKLDAVKQARASSAKLERLMELLPVLLDEGRRVLVFSQFTSMLALIEERLKKEDLAYELLTGDTQDRRGPVARFQSGKSRLFLLSLKAGGTGLNLTAADTVIHYDPWWNPAVEDQATDRAHRIGQDKPVFVHRLVASDTIEDKMEDLKARKRALVEGILAGTGTGALGLTEADVEHLFA